MLEKFMTNSRVTEVDAGSMRMIGAFESIGRYPMLGALTPLG